MSVNIGDCTTFSTITGGGMGVWPKHALTVHWGFMTRRQRTRQALAW